MAMLDLYKTLKEEAFRIFMEEKEKRKRAIKIRMEVQKKVFDKKRDMH